MARLAQILRMGSEHFKSVALSRTFPPRNVSVGSHPEKLALSITSLLYPEQPT